MKKLDAIAKMKEEARRNAFEARIYDEILCYGLNTTMNRFYRDQAQGKALGLLDAIWYLDDKFSRDDHYEAAVEEATQAIYAATKDGIDFDHLYILAGYTPQSHERDIEEFWATQNNMYKRSKSQ